jgi:hypothetical protein
MQSPCVKFHFARGRMAIRCVSSTRRDACPARPFRTGCRRVECGQEPFRRPPAYAAQAGQTSWKAWASRRTVGKNPRTARGYVSRSRLARRTKSFSLKTFTRSVEPDGFGSASYASAAEPRPEVPTPIQSPWRAGLPPSRGGNPEENLAQWGVRPIYWPTFRG